VQEKKEPSEIFEKLWAEAGESIINEGRTGIGPVGISV